MKIEKQTQMLEWRTFNKLLRQCFLSLSNEINLYLSNTVLELGPKSHYSVIYRMYLL